MNSGEPRPTQEMYQHGITVPQTDPHQREEANAQGATTTSTHDDSLMNSVKEGAKNAADKVQHEVNKKI